ncbi:hypothetical protein HFP57_08560 [Parasphingopyxis algicola]|uniref:hypothetical protein n=1 Tax=Parasphingopyxis algicola TaxID=2026624 RepID=UPI0015A18739|nr:hypothetical protein [Parasphingopyxis algicola]QLC25072.1 hypothetical protein HFP57_08560 [Parasphingopyxis algicola]
MFLPSSRSLKLKSLPKRGEQPDSFEMAIRSVQEPGQNEILVRNLYLFVESAFSDSVDKFEPHSAYFLVDEVVRALAICEVVKSQNPLFDVGSRIFGWFGLQEWATVRDPEIVLRVKDGDEKKLIELSEIRDGWGACLDAIVQYFPPSPELRRIVRLHGEIDG